MSDHLDRLDEQGLPEWVGALLRRPARLAPDARARLMRRVQAAARPRRVSRAAWSTRPGLASFASLAAAAACTMLVAFGALRTPLTVTQPDAASGVAALLHDSLHVSAGEASHDTLGAALLRDTLRLVRFVLVAPGASGLALAGDFSGWRPLPMTSAAESTGTWVATVRLRPGTHRYTVMMHDTSRGPDGAAVRTRAGGLSSVTVPATRN